MNNLILQAQEAQACRACDLAKSRRQAVFGSGPSDARLMVIGEAPGRHEDEGGAPFIGRSGQVLVRLLEEELGLGRDDVYIANAVKCRPPENRTPTKQEIVACGPRLAAQIAALGPRVLLCVGATAQRAVIGDASPMREAHGQIFETRCGAKAVVTYHPAAALRGGSRIVDLMRQDLHVVRALLSTAS